jgi:deazaflavin-dependent oxidoreductase (nitroreductase family)
MNLLTRALVKTFTAAHVFLYRTSGGRIGGKVRGLNVLLLTTVGRKTTVRRTIPLGYIRDGANYVIAASNGGQDRNPGWYFNLQQNVLTEIQIAGTFMSANAETATADERSRLWTLVTTAAPAYAHYENSTTREIPVVVLTPIPA